MVLPDKIVVFKLLKEMDEVVTNAPTTVLATILLPAIVENKIFPRIEEPNNDEMTSVLPFIVEKSMDANPFIVDMIDVDTAIVLPLSVDIFKPFAFIVDVTALETVMMFPARVEYTTEPPYILEINAVETVSELAVMVEKTTLPE